MKIRLNSVMVADQEHALRLDVSFRSQPTDAGGVTIAVYDDTCGNLVQIYQTLY